MLDSYSAVSQDEEKLLSSNDVTNSESSLDLQRPRIDSARSYIPDLAGLLHWIFHGLTICLLVVIVMRPTQCSSNPKSWKTLFSPAFPTQEPPKHFEIFKAAFWQDTPYKAYPDPPNKETMAAWHRITRTPMLNLTASEMSQLGLPTSSAQFPSHAGGGYFGYLESTHQLHCLEAIWQRHHYDKDPTNPLYTLMAQKIAELPDIEEAHFEHCVDVIRQRLMCTADDSVVTFQWVKGISGPYPNFHTGHMCANYEGLIDWAHEREADLSMIGDWQWSPGPDDFQIDHLP